MGKTVEMELKSEDTIWKNIIPQNRNTIRKAIKNGVPIKHGKGLSLFEKFTGIYNSIMDHNQAKILFQKVCLK